METRYLTIDAKQLTVYGEGTRASGGSAVYYTTLPRSRRAARPGTVVDFQEYRRQCVAAQKPMPEEDSPAPLEREKKARLDLLPDLVAAAAVVCMVVLVSIKFMML